MGQRGVAGAEIIDRDRQPLRPQRAQRGRRVLDVVDQQALGQLQLQPLALGTGLLQQPHDRVGKAVEVELHARQVDRDAHRAVALGQLLLAPTPRRDGRFAQHPFAQRQHQPVALGDEDEGIGAEQPALRMAPAQQGLGADHAAADQLDLRLVDDEEPVLLETGAQALEQLEALAGIAAHGGREVLRRAALLLFGALERDLGV
mmetsp:Transcript_21514/g.83510  ORF Transcript_21514/g.83510 Transcript_21514/m.83510 type:complete len:203 (-) Transcript_21514:309-917(-)